MDWIKEVNPDLLCLQETKVEDKSFPKEQFEEYGYHTYFHGQKSYNGVALLSKEPLNDVRFGIKDELKNNDEAEKLSEQKRVISALIEGIRIVNIYVPNGSSVNSDKYDYKIKWLKCMKKYLEAQSKREEPLCLLGDINIAPDDRDIHNPEKLTGSIMASELERKCLRDLLNKRLEDVFRIFEPHSGHWSWWDYRSSAWERDKGWRIDQIYLSEELIQNAKSCKIHKKVRSNLKPSDHAPVVVEINWPAEDLEDSFPYFT